MGSTELIGNGNHERGYPRCFRPYPMYNPHRLPLNLIISYWKIKVLRLFIRDLFFRNIRSILSDKFNEITTRRFQTQELVRTISKIFTQPKPKPEPKVEHEPKPEPEAFQQKSALIPTFDFNPLDVSQINMGTQWQYLTNLPCLR